MLTLVASLFLTFTASAQSQTANCNVKDWQLISRAVRSGTIAEGERYKAEFIGFIEEEAMPLCRKLVQTTPRPSIPGQKSHEYQLSSGSRQFQLLVTVSFDGSDVRAFLKKN